MNLDDFMLSSVANDKKLEYPYHTAEAVEMQEVVYKKVSKSNSPPCFVPFTHGRSCVKIRLQPAPLCRRGALLWYMIRS